MTPKQRYDERKRMKAEREYDREKEAYDFHKRNEQRDLDVERFVAAIERIADVLEFWADQQVDAPTQPTN